MKNILDKFSHLLFPQYGKFSFIILKNKINILKKRRYHRFLFILSPPYCGSTLLAELISSSKSVSINNPFGTREGQKLPTVRKIMFEHKNRWDTSFDFDWKIIKKEWMKYWDLSCPILLDKSPPNIIRTKSIINLFNPSYFIIFYRNPYAQCESLIRRHNMKPLLAAEFVLRSLEYQIQNISAIENAVNISYEFLTEQTENAIKIMTTLLPELKDIQSDQEFSAHNYYSKKLKIKNLNIDSINRLTNEQLQEINTVFSKKKEILNFFKYNLIEEST